MPRRTQAVESRPCKLHGEHPLTVRPDGKYEHWYGPYGVGKSVWICRVKEDQRQKLRHAKAHEAAKKTSARKSSAKKSARKTVRRPQKS